MKASELVKQLLQQIEERGDCEVVAAELYEGNEISEVYPCGFNIVTDKILIRIEL